MKYTGQDIPPELLSAYKELISNASATMPTDGTARTRRSARQPIPRDKAKPDEWAAVAAQVYKEIKGIPGIDTKGNFISEEYNRLKDGIFNPIYWLEAQEASRHYLTSTAENTPNPDPPPYAYRDPENMPSLVTYPNGTIDEDPMRTSGATISGYWHDLQMVWERSSYELTQNGQRPAQLPLCWTTAGAIVADADMRASRSMLGIIAKASLTDTDDPSADTTEPPTHPMISLYWLYDIPPTDPPYYHATVQIARKFVLNGSIDIPEGISPKRLIMLTAPRPAFGESYNNNTSITTKYYGQNKIFQLMPCLNEPPEPDGWIDIQIAWFDGNSYQTEASTVDKTSKWPASQLAKTRKKWEDMNKPPIWYQSDENPANWIVRNINQAPPSNYTARGEMTYLHKGEKTEEYMEIFSQEDLQNRNVTWETGGYASYFCQFEFTGCN